MKRIAIIVSSQNGQTEKIASGMAEQLQRKGVESDVFNLTKGQKPTAEQVAMYEGFIIGAPVHQGEFPMDILDWAWENGAAMADLPTGLFTVSFNAADRRHRARAADDKMLRRFMKETDMRPRFVGTFAGALAYTKYSFFKKSVMQGMAASVGLPTNTMKDFELTNWFDVFEFSEAFQSQNMTSKSAAVNRLQWTPEPLWPMSLQRAA
jgi:menaquinone-dependent protoporphyrinogen oxidase